MGGRGAGQQGRNGGGEGYDFMICYEGYQLKEADDVTV